MFKYIIINRLWYRHVISGNVPSDKFSLCVGLAIIANLYYISTAKDKLVPIKLTHLLFHNPYLILQGGFVF